jgi:hypothetical protein
MKLVDGQVSTAIFQRRPTCHVGKEIAVPFRDHATVFTPEQLDVLTNVFYVVRAELSTAGVQITKTDLANCILHHAGKGIFDAAELKSAALESLLASDSAQANLDGGL